MRIFTLLGGLFLLISSYVQAQTYCRPTGTLPAWAHAASQSFYSIKVTSSGSNVFSYTDEACASAYNWLQDTQTFNVTKGQNLSIEVRSGIWSWDIQIGFDWDGNGEFEDIRRAFSTANSPITQATSSWSSTYASTFANGEWRQSEQRRLGHRGVVYHTFNVTVPETAITGRTRLRVLCDGDGYEGGIPSFDMCGKVGYAGSMHDFGMIISNLAVVENPVVSPRGATYMSDPSISITTGTADAKIYYTLDGSEPTPETGTRYTDSFVLNAPEGSTTSFVLKAIAVKDGMQSSSIVTENYTIQKAWSLGKGTIHPTELRYVTSATTTGAKSDLSFTQNADPRMVYINTGREMTVEQGSSFVLNVQTTEQMKWDHAIIFVDWNKNYSFDDNGEQLVKIGEEKRGNIEVTNFTHTISVPSNATVGATRMRIQFTDAWHKKDIPNHEHSAEDAVDKGGVYDFVVNIEEAVASGIHEVEVKSLDNKKVEIYTINGIKVMNDLSKLPKGIYLVNGKKVVIN